MKKISPSMMCADFSQLDKTLAIFEDNAIEYLHIDVMDGMFVPNLALGTDIVKQLRAKTNIPLDTHLMVKKPERVIPWFDFQPGEVVAIHFESCLHIQRTLAMIRDTGAKAMLALNPATPPAVMEYLLDDIDGVLIMTVNPGFAGQKAVPMAVTKIAATRKYLNEKGYPHIQIEVDGNVSYELAPKMASLGADVFVAGSSSFFTSVDKLDSGIKKFREIIQ